VTASEGSPGSEETPDVERPRVDEPVRLAFERFIGSARWFGGKGRGFHVEALDHLGWLPEPDPADGAGSAGDPGRGSANADQAGAPHVRVELVTVRYDDGDADVYQLPVAYYAEAQERLEHALVGQWDDPDRGAVCAYDALHDRVATAMWLRAFRDEHTDGRLSFHRLAGHDLDVDAHGALFSGEQSNSSVAFGEDSLMKVFRKVTPGRNPDIEIHEALTEHEVNEVASLYGWVEAAPAPDAPGAEPPTQLAMLQEYLRTGSDGWDLALASVRDLFAEADLHADEVGGDFAAEAHRLGEATARVHDALREHFPSDTWKAEDLAHLAQSMRRRLDEAVEVVPELEAHADALRTTYDSLADVDEPVVVQRVHGDFHLGQTLRTVYGWKIVDFEGEPAKPLAERLEPDSAWRDVAGMLRSFDYAAHAVEMDAEQDSEQIAYRALEWARRNRGAFLDGYAEATGRTDGELTPGQRLLLGAYESDKAVYEAVYEARNRPGWLSIPLGAIARLAESTQEATP